MAGNSYIPSDGTRLWRYMRLNSFLELLSGHLIQTRIDVSDSRQTFIDAVKRVVESIFAFDGKRFAGEIAGSARDEDLVPQT